MARADLFLRCAPRSYDRDMQTPPAGAVDRDAALVLSFSEIGESDLPLVGGKGKNLGVLSAAGFPVPPGFCVTTRAFRELVSGCAELESLYAALEALDPGDIAGTRVTAERVRTALLAVPMPAAIAASIVRAWQALGEEPAYAVRSSATAEDLPGASFAGQQDTYLNIRGEAALLEAVRRCWASLFTERAVLYRNKNGFGHRGVSLSVVVQRMVLPEAAGILFTADPVSGHRGIISIDAGFGLGEALVSGLVTADLYRVEKATGRILETRIGDKAIAIRPLPEGGTRTVELSDSQRQSRVLSDDQVTALAKLGMRIEAHYGSPQDIEWCSERGTLYVVQARPITSLFPLVTHNADPGSLRVFMSFGHGQNMTEPVTPLGRDVLRLLFPFGKERLDQPPQGPTAFGVAGGRLYLDVTTALRSPLWWRILSTLLHSVYPAIAEALADLRRRPEIESQPATAPKSAKALLRLLPPIVLGAQQRLWRGKPEEWVRETGERVDELVAHFYRQIHAAPPGAERLRAAEQAAASLFLHIRRLPPPLVAGLLARGLLKRILPAQEGRIESLLVGLRGNVTTEMDLRVGDLADLARPHPALVTALREAVKQNAENERQQRPPLRFDDLQEALRALPGGSEFLAALRDFLERFGMRGPAEIDVGRRRWSEAPVMLLSTIVGSLSQDESGVHRTRFARLQEEAQATLATLIADSAQGPLGWLRAALVERLGRVMRGGLAIREHPKYGLVRCLALVRSTALEAGEALVRRGQLRAVDDVVFLSLEELIRIMAGGATEVQATVAARRAEHRRFQSLSPPLVVTSQGEQVQPKARTDVPPGALAGLGVSAGIIEGVARVVLDPTTELLHAGEILVAPYTDPGWTPLFVHAAGLVCDVGGMMTHGSVIAREYGIPAVVGVGNGTQRLRSGQRIRVDGARGIVEVLAEPPATSG